MGDSGGAGNRPSRGSGSFTVHPAEELEVYFNEVAHGRPVGFVASAKWKPPTDIFETEDALIVYMDIAGMHSEDFTVEYVDGILTIGGERKARRNEGKPHYHAMEVQVGPFERPDLHLHRVVVRLPLVAPGLALAPDREDAVHVLDREVLRVHPRDVHVDDQRVLGLEDIGRRLPLGGRDEAHRAPVRDLVEIDFELFGGMHREGARAPRGPVARTAAIAHGILPRSRGPVPRTGGIARPARALRPSRARGSRRLSS